MMTRNLFKILVIAVLAVSAQLAAAFDPVNDDTDIFLANPSIAAERPNILIILDNTANWNTAFVNEKAALVSVVNSLNDNYNVGLAMFPETGGGNDSVDGGYIRFAVRQMTAANKSALSTMVNNLDQTGDKGNNATPSLAMYEAYAYFAGIASRAGHGKVKRDFSGNTANNPLAASLPRNAFSSSASQTYTSPITDPCQKNFIIYISNGPAGENSSALSTAQTLLQTISGQSPTQIAINPSGSQGNWTDEYAKFFANSDISTTHAGIQNILTYTVEVDPGTGGQGPNMTALMRSTATNGKGKYFGVTSGGAGASIVSALQAIFQEVQAVNSVFASSTLPVSVNVRGTNLNQVYIGVFRPDAQKSPRWLGNLKAYKLGLSTATNSVFLADANGLPAENSATGFITGSAQSFWTQGSNFWNFNPQGIGGSSDSPDGDLVEKGGAAQQIRAAFPASQTSRNLYTCTQGSFGNCVAGSQLSSFPFNTTNTDINAASLSLGSLAVTSLTGFRTNAVTTLTDRKAINSLSNAATPSTLTGLSNGATTVSVSSLTTASTQAISTLDARVTGSGTVNVSTIQKVSGSFVVTTASAHGFSSGNSVTIAGNTVSAYNGVWNVTVTSATAFTIPASGNPGNGTGGTATGPALVNSTTATATVASTAGFVAGTTSVTISGAAPAAFNGTYTVAGVTSATKFTYIIASSQGLATAPGAAATNTNTATAIAASHGLSAGNSFTMYGANPTNYNGTFTVAASPAPSTNQFSYTVTGNPSVNTASGVFLVRGGSTTVTATTSLVHGFVVGQSVQISSTAPSAWNGTYTIVTVPTLNTFTFTTPTVLPAVTTFGTASTATLPMVTATVPGHGFSIGDSVIVEGAVPAAHNGTWSITAVTANTFTYSTGSALAAPTTPGTVRPAVAKAYATVTAHGYATGDQIVIAGATPAAYNGTFTITKVDNDNFVYSPISTPGGVNTGTSVTSSIKTTTATAVAFNHGYTSGQTVVIAGATPGAFNGSFIITVVNTNTFTYPIGSAEGNATGSIVAVSSSSAAASQVSPLINWVRGQDNLADENADGALTDIRASVHGDVLHSRPAVVNYDRFRSDASYADSDVFIFYGTNDGVFRAVKGGFTNKSGQPTVGSEVWGFVPPEFFPNLNRLRNGAPPISSSNKKPYFADGSIGVFTKDNNGDGKIDTTIDANDKAWLFISMRRGGRLLYALDVSNPQNPKFMWKKDNTSAGYEELGFTFSEPKVISQINGHTGPVLVFAAGYDPAVEDLDPATITSSTSTTVTTASGTVTRSMGRGIYIVDAATGDIIWAAGAQARPATLPVSATYVQVSGMTCSIPSDIAVLRNNGGIIINRGYVGDTCGNVWRIDFNDASVSNWRATKLASIASTAAASGRRKFLFAPDVVYNGSTDAVLMGSGDREHPFDTTVINRMYMFKDAGVLTDPVSGNVSTRPALSPAGANPTTLESAMFDATSNCIQTASACASGVTPGDALGSLNSSSGWFITLDSGEKVIGGAVTLAGTTFFNTNLPSASAGGGACGSNLGIAREYQVSFSDASSVNDLNPGGGLTLADRFAVHAGGGYLPTPVPVVVQIDGQTVQAVISGVSVQQAPGATLQSRLRKYWYKEME